MARDGYTRQVALLLSVLPEVAKEDCFALHGGTAINLFVQNMPRLSVDIDLTFIPIEDRESSLQHIAEALERIKANIERAIAGVQVSHKRDIAKLLVASRDAVIKVEVNLTKRGVIDAVAEMPLCQKAQDEFEAFVAMPMVSIGQLYGGKICAALNRQHPRDLFDVWRWLPTQGFTDEIKRGFLYGLLGSNGPIREILDPNPIDQRLAMENQFNGMSDLEFSYAQFEETRVELINRIRQNLTPADKEFILSVKRLEPDWGYHDFSPFPSVNWKLQHLQILKNANIANFQRAYDALKETLEGF